MLFDPGRHEPLTDTAWDASRAHEALTAIVRDTEQQQLPSGHWPVHPNDEDGELPSDGAFKSLYLGSAGVWWALWTLQREGAVALKHDPAAGIAQAVAAYAAAPDTGEVVPSYFLGEVGIRLVQWRLTGSAAAADALFASIEANIPNPTNEALWAAPGTMIAAWHLWQATGEQRWRALFLANVDQVWRTWLWDEAAQCHLWTQDMYGRVVQYLGAGHGFAGNACALLKGLTLLDEERRATLLARIEATLRRFAVREGDAANWPPGTYKPRPGAAPLLMQWCHGAPGFVTALADFPPGASAEVDALLGAAGQAIWQAGPLTKGPGVCHGTAGNGYAFLKLHRRTGEPLWLDRARAFAMHAVAQCEQRRADSGRGRHTLWTGDLGLAVYLWHCLQAGDAMPALDSV
jgi:Lanthionine synthetase C-like protein